MLTLVLLLLLGLTALFVLPPLFREDQGRRP